MTKLNIQTEQDKQNSISFRYGGVGTEIKLYFNTAEDLEQQLVELNNKCNIVRHNIDEIKHKLGNQNE